MAIYRGSGYIIEWIGDVATIQSTDVGGRWTIHVCPLTGLADALYAAGNGRIPYLATWLELDGRTRGGCDPMNFRPSMTLTHGPMHAHWFMDRLGCTPEQAGVMADALEIYQGVPKPKTPKEPL